MNKKQKLKKEKKRKEIARNRVLRRREELRKAERWSWNYGKAMNEFAPKLRPIRNDELVNGVVDEAARHDQSIKERLEHNMKILEALEQQYDAEMKAKEVVQGKMKEAGAETFRDQLDLISQKVDDILDKSDDQRVKLKGHFDVDFKPKSEEKNGN